MSDIRLTGSINRLGDVMRRYAELRGLTAQEVVVRTASKFQRALFFRTRNRAPGSGNIRQETRGKAIRIRKEVRQRIADKYGTRMHDAGGRVFGVTRTRSGKLRKQYGLRHKDKATGTVRRLNYSQALREAELSAREKSRYFVSHSMRLPLRDLDRGIEAVDRKGRAGQILSTATLNRLPDGPTLAMQFGSANTSIGEALTSPDLMPEVDAALTDTINDTLEYVARKEEAAFERALVEALK